MQVIRAFFAVNLSVSVLRDIAEVGRVERQRCADFGWKIKWIAPPNLHVVLRYLGPIGCALPTALRDQVGPLVAAVPPLPLRARGLRALELPGATDDNGRPTVVVASVDDETGQLATLRASLARPLSEVGLSPGRATVEPPGTHLVVGRVLERGQAPLDELLAEWGHTDFGRSLARELILYRSDNATAGQEYPQLWRLPLTGTARPPGRAAPVEQEHPAVLPGEPASAPAATTGPPPEGASPSSEAHRPAPQPKGTATQSPAPGPAVTPEEQGGGNEREDQAPLDATGQSTPKEGEPEEQQGRHRPARR